MLIVMGYITIFIGAITLLGAIVTIILSALTQMIGNVKLGFSSQLCKTLTQACVKILIMMFLVTSLLVIIVQ